MLGTLALLIEAFFSACVFFQVLGTPTREEIHAMNPNYTEFKFPQIKAHPWSKVFSKRLPPEAVDLVGDAVWHVGCVEPLDNLCPVYLPMTMHIPPSAPTRTGVQAAAVCTAQAPGRRRCDDTPVFRRAARPSSPPAQWQASAATAELAAGRA